VTRSPVFVVAANTFREVGRDRVLHLLGAAITCFVLFAWVLGWLNPEEKDQARVLVDFGLAAVNLFGLLMAVFLGSSLLRREMERRTLYTVLSREVTRTQFVLGKYLGLLAVFATGLAIVAVVMLAYFAFWGAAPGAPLLAAVYGNLLELAVLTAVTVCVGSFSTPTMAAFATVAVYGAGQRTETLLDYGRMPGNEHLELPIRVVYHLFPNLTDFDYRLAASFGDAVPGATLLAATGYAAIWTALLLGAGALLFRRRELP
jgi:ABC-type Na+ efflux pump permease subunit